MIYNIDIINRSNSDAIMSGIFYLKNFDCFDRNKLLLVCLHGNSSCADTFSLIRKHINSNVQVVAPDLPGCGKSTRLVKYSMKILGKMIGDFIENTFHPTILYVFGHSLGGHLIAYLHNKIDGIILSGTPPLSCDNDFSLAFKSSQDTMKLLSLLSKPIPFTKDEATMFVDHTGVTGIFRDIMIENAILADGKFRSGCLATLTDIDQKSIIEASNNVVIFHASNDGVINPDYLESINKRCLYQNKIHYLEGRHMTPINNYREIITILEAIIL